MAVLGVVKPAYLVFLLEKYMKTTVRVFVKCGNSTYSRMVKFGGNEVFTNAFFFFIIFVRCLLRLLPQGKTWHCK